MQILLYTISIYKIILVELIGSTISPSKLLDNKTNDWYKALAYNMNLGLAVDFICVIPLNSAT